MLLLLDLLIFSLFNELCLFSFLVDEFMAKLDRFMNDYAETEFIEILKFDAQFASPGMDPLAFERYFLLLRFFFDPDKFSDLLY